MRSRVNFYSANKKAKIIVWANSGHIVKKSLNGEIGKMGEAIAAKNPGNYFSIGLCTSEGSYSYLNKNFINDDHIFNDTLFNKTLAEVRSDSWNALLGKEQKASYLLKFSRFSADQVKFYSIAKPLRFVGFRKENPLKVYFNTDPYSRFDMLVFMRKTNHTTRLFFGTN